MNKLVKLISLSTAMAGLFFFSSCEPKKIDPKNEGVDEYLPTKTDNWWLYEANDSTIFKRYYTGRDTVIDNFNYNYFEQVDTVTGRIVKEFYAKFEGNYYTLLKINDEGTAYLKAQVLNGNPQVGSTWENTGTITYGITFAAKITGEVTNINGTETINGTVHTDIITVKNRLYARLTALDPWTDCGTVIMKFKKGLGIISENYDIHVLGFVDNNYSNQIIDYHIVP